MDGPSCVVCTARQPWQAAGELVRSPTNQNVLWVYGLVFARHCGCLKQRPPPTLLTRWWRFVHDPPRECQAHVQRSSAASVVAKLQHAPRQIHTRTAMGQMGHENAHRKHGLSSASMPRADAHLDITHLSSERVSRTGVPRMSVNGNIAQEPAWTARRVSTTPLADVCEAVCISTPSMSWVPPQHLTASARFCIPSCNATPNSSFAQARRQAPTYRVPDAVRTEGRELCCAMHTPWS